MIWYKIRCTLVDGEVSATNLVKAYKFLKSLVLLTKIITALKIDKM